MQQRLRAQSEVEALQKELVSVRRELEASRGETLRKEAEGRQTIERFENHRVEVSKTNVFIFVAAPFWDSCLLHM